MPSTSLSPSTQVAPFRIAGGAVDVFVVAADERRWFGATVPDGAVGMPLKAAGVRLQVVPRAGSTVQPLPMDAPVAAPAVRAWMHALAQAVDVLWEAARLDPDSRPVLPDPPDLTDGIEEAPAATVVPRLDAWQSAVAAHLATILDARLAQETDVLAARGRHQEAAMDGALRSLAALFDDGTAPTDTPDTAPLVAACRAVGNALDVEIVDPGPDDEGRLSVRRIARASNIRTRKVVLRGRWWRHDNGPLVARYADGDPSDPTWPVALLPRPAGGYDCVDGATGTRTRVDAALADALDGFAYALYRPFPARPLGWADVLAFALRPCRRDLLTLLIMSAAAGALAVAVPVVTGLIVNHVVPGAHTGHLLQLTALLLICAGVAACFRMTRGAALLRLQGRAEAAVQAALWDRLLRLPIGFFRPYTAGDVAQRAMSIRAMQRRLTGPTLTALLGGVFSLFQFGLLFMYSPRLALWALGLTVGALAITMGPGMMQLRLDRQITRAENRLSGLVLQLLDGIAKLRVAGAERAAFARWARLFAEKRHLQVRKRRVQNVAAAVARVVPLAVTLTLYALAVPVLTSGALRPGDLIAFLAALAAGLTALLAMRPAIEQVFAVVPLYENARPILQATPETSTAHRDPGRLRGELEIRHVTFRYDPDGAPVLRDVSLTVKPGQFVALVGPSGSGKSTVLRLLLGFERPETGAVYVDGHDLAGLDVDAVRRQIGVVLQDGALMPGDLLRNIVGSTGATVDDAWAAAEQAGLADDIRAMPMGLHTVVSAGGSTLSGGQVQRLLIARAIVHRPRLLFFDEATSALDNRTQAQVSRSLHALRATRIVVAHRLSTVRDADVIYVLDRGRVVESGTYDALLQADGVFARLAERQV